MFIATRREQPLGYRSPSGEVSSAEDVGNGDEPILYKPIAQPLTFHGADHLLAFLVPRRRRLPTPGLLLRALVFNTFPAPVLEQTCA